MKKRGRIIITIIYMLFLFTPFFIFLRDFGDLTQVFSIFDKRTAMIFRNTFLQALFSVIISFIISIAPAVYISKKNNFLSKLIEQTIFIPFFFPVISTVISFSILYTISNNSIRSLFFYNIFSVVAAHTFYNSPIFVKYIGDALKRIPVEIIEGAKCDGASNFKILFFIELPIIKRTIARAAFMVFVYSFMSFAVVLSMGGIKYSSFETAIAATLNADGDFVRAALYAVFQFVFIKIIAAILNKSEKYELNENRNIREENVGIIIKLGALFFTFMEYFIIIVGITASFYNFYIGRFDFSGIINLFSYEFIKEQKILESILNSLLLSLTASIFVTFFAYILLKTRNKATDIIVMGAMGISTSFFAISIFYLNVVYQIPFFILVALGYIMTMVPISYNYLYRYINGFDKTIVEASITDGADSFQRFRYIEFPIVFPNLLGSIMQIFAIAFGEFTIVYTMQIQDYLPVSSVTNYSLFSQRYYMEGSALSFINIVVIFVLFYISNNISKKEFNK